MLQALRLLSSSIVYQSTPIYATVPTCGTCGRSFRALAHVRSHQTRVCSAPHVGEPDNHEMQDPVLHIEPDLQPFLHDVQVTEQPPSTSLTEDSYSQNVNDSQHDSPIPILEALDDRKRVSDDIHLFYKSLIQHSEPVVSAPVNVLHRVRQCPEYVQRFIDNCSDKTLSKQAITAIYDTVASYETNLPEKLRLVTEHIPSAGHLHALLRAIRTDRLYEEGWRKDVID